MLPGCWDIHNHILPGVDDGSCDMELTFQMLLEEYKQGIRNIVFTPHYRPGMFRVRASEREEVYHEVCREFQDYFPAMNFYLGCELFAHERVLESVRDVRCRMAGTRVVLEEFSTSGHFHYLHQIVAETIEEGYRPIIAHVERYQCLTKDVERIRQLKRMGALIQINAGSILGNGGWKMKRFCHILLDDNLVDLVASDAHNMDTRPIQMASCIARIEKKYGRNVAKKLFVKNPDKLFSPFNYTDSNII